MAGGFCGTDVRIFEGKYLGSHPIIPGHEFAGIVKKVGSSVMRVEASKRVVLFPYTGFYYKNGWPKRPRWAT